LLVLLLLPSFAACLFAVQVVDVATDAAKERFNEVSRTAGCSRYGIASSDPRARYSSIHSNYTQPNMKMAACTRLHKHMALQLQLSKCRAALGP
jgi:hypothetical protein